MNKIINNFFVIQRSQQGTIPNNQNYQRVSEDVDLFAKLDINCSREDIGKGINI